MPSLSSGRGRDEVAERLLVAEHEAPLRMIEDRAPDPLEPGERLGEVHTGRRRHLAEQRRRHERRDHDAVVTRCVGEQVVGEQPPDLVAAESPPRAVGLRDRRTQPVGVGVVGDGDSRPLLPGQRDHQVHRPRLLRVRERNGGEGGVGRILLVDDERPSEAGPFERGSDDVAADAVHRCVRDRHSGDLGSAAHRRDARQVALQHVVAEMLDQRIVGVGEDDVGRIDARRCSADIPMSCGGTI